MLYLSIPSSLITKTACFENIIFIIATYVLIEIFLILKFIRIKKFTYDLMSFYSLKLFQMLYFILCNCSKYYILWNNVKSFQCSCQTFLWGKELRESIFIYWAYPSSESFKSQTSNNSDDLTKWISSSKYSYALVGAQIKRVGRQSYLL